ncbi:hypothetical protein SCLCIDRAFT_1006552 [Scleroderma citrinum Foug A]|uniref:Uncharacterized protein n=1 Tax=Scleroderma citrinum Foug A TaxID=1036808 RepID=A0A0C3EJR4_9AGAM|nr:hypothetical protein SCLCIDRAFT_1006552 [Scleroderma citrinum Foug A]
MENGQCRSYRRVRTGGTRQWGVKDCIILGEVESADDGIEREGDYGSDVEGEMKGDVDGERDEGKDSVGDTTSGSDIPSVGGPRWFVVVSYFPFAADTITAVRGVKIGCCMV